MNKRFDVKEAVVVVVDVQNDFCHPDGVVARSGKDVSSPSKITINLKPFIEDARALRIPVVFVRTTHSDATTADSWRYRSGIEEKEPNCLEGSWGAEFYDFRPLPADIVVTKHRYSAFASAEFVAALKQLERSSLFICGVATNICVETTLRDATCADYYATLIDDCSAAYSNEAHERTIRNVNGSFGVVRDSKNLTRTWK